MFCLFCYLLIWRKRLFIVGNFLAFSANIFRFCCKNTKRIGDWMGIKSKRLQKSYQMHSIDDFIIFVNDNFTKERFFLVILQSEN